MHDFSLSTRQAAAAGEVSARQAARPARPRHTAKPPAHVPDLSSLQGDVNAGLAYTPDGRQLLAVGSDNSVKFLDPVRGRVTRSLQGHEYLISAMALSPDGGLLATGTWSKTINLWETASGKLRYTLDQHHGKIGSLAFSPDGRRLASGSWDASVRLWDMDDGRLLAVYAGHGERVSAVSFSADGELLISASEDHSLRVWPARAPLPPQTNPGAWRGRALRTLRGHLAQVTAARCGPDGHTLVSGDAGGTIHLWHLDSRWLRRWYGFLLPLAPVDTLRGHESKITCLALSPDGEILASASEEPQIILWDLASGWVRHVLQGHAQPAIALAFSPDGRTLASAGRDHTLRLWDTGHGKPLASYTTTQLPEVLE